MMSLMTTGVPVADTRSWLVAAVCNAARKEWKRRGPAGEIADGEESVDDAAERIEQGLLLREVLTRLSQRDRDILHLRYWEGLRANEIAARFEVTTARAEKLIHGALRRARRELARGQEPAPHRRRSDALRRTGE